MNPPIFAHVHDMKFDSKLRFEAARIKFDPSPDQGLEGVAAKKQLAKLATRCTKPQLDRFNMDSTKKKRPPLMNSQH